MACLFRKRFFSCLKSKQNSVESGTYRRNGEFNTNLPANTTQQNTSTGQEITVGQQAHEIHEWTIPDRESTINIISSPVNMNTLARGTVNQATTNDQESFPLEIPPPSYSSLFYCPPPKYEDVVMGAQ